MMKSTQMDANQMAVADLEGLGATLRIDPRADTSGQVDLALESGERVCVPAERLKPIAESGDMASASLNEDGVSQPHESQAVIPVVQEEVHVGKQAQPTGRVAVRIEPQERQEVVEVDLEEERVEIERVPVNRPVETASPVRQDGDVTIIPVFEEVVVVEKRLMLKEEIRMRRRRQTRRERKTVTLRHEEAHIIRTAPPPEQPPANIT